MHQCYNLPFYLWDYITALFFVMICQHACSALSKTALLWHWSSGFHIIIRDHAGWSIMRNRKQKNMLNFWFKKRSRLFIRNLSSGCLWESFWDRIWLTNKTVFQVVTYGNWSLMKSSWCERVDCILNYLFIINFFLLLFHCPFLYV